MSRPRRHNPPKSKTAPANRGLPLDASRESLPVVVHTSADDIARKIDAGGRAHDGETNAAPGGPERTVRKGHAAQVVMEILDLHAPLRHKHPFQASTSRPSGAHLRKRTRCRCAGLETRWEEMYSRYWIE